MTVMLIKEKSERNTLEIENGILIVLYFFKTDNQDDARNLNRKRQRLYVVQKVTGQSELDKIYISFKIKRSATQHH